VFGKFNIAEALRHQGINPCTVAEGRNADAQFPFSDWTPDQERQVNFLVDHTYSGFIRKVSHCHPIVLVIIIGVWTNVNCLFRNPSKLRQPHVRSPHDLAQRLTDPEVDP
jgi:hypothetical protein